MEQVREARSRVARVPILARLFAGGFRNVSAVRLDDARVTEQSVKRCARQQQITKQRWPLLDRAIRREDRRAALVALEMIS